MLFVFMSQPDFSCNSYALWKYIVENTSNETAWIIKNIDYLKNLRERNVRCELYDTLGARKLLDEADYIITNSYTFIQVPKKENQIMVNLWHGSGIKAHDFYNHDINPEHARKLNNFFEKVDLMCVHSLDDRFKLAAQLNYKLNQCYVTGQARLDCVKKSDGIEKLKKIYGEKIEKFDKFIFFAPSFRANMSSHSGTIFSENIFRLDDYNDEKLSSVLKKNNAALIYKLHPIEQTAFAGRKFEMNENCFELKDSMLFYNDIRYDEILNAFDIMMSDYSSIAYDYLLLNRPIVYLIPDYNEYKSTKGFVFHNIDLFMPGAKAFNFEQMIDAIEESFESPNKYKNERENVLAQRFDYVDDEAAKRCYETIMNYKKPVEAIDILEVGSRVKMPSSAELLKRFIPSDRHVIDSTKEIDFQYKTENIKKMLQNKYIYITEEMPDEFRKLTGFSSTEIVDIEHYYDICKLPNVKVAHITGGVDYNKFDLPKVANQNKRKRIGFAGTIDNRIYFAMVQCICEVFSDCDVIFAGEIFGKFPVWLNGFENLHYVETSYDELPEMIQSFDVAILPFFARHMLCVPKEFYQFLAVGKQVVASYMVNLPTSNAVYISESISDAIENIKKALEYVDDNDIFIAAKQLAKQHEWEDIARHILFD